MHAEMHAAKGVQKATDLTQEATLTRATAGILTCRQAVNVFPNAGSVTCVYAAKGNSQQPDCTGFSPVSLLNALVGVPVALAKLRKKVELGGLCADIWCVWGRVNVGGFHGITSHVMT